MQALLRESIIRPLLQTIPAKGVTVKVWFSEYGFLTVSNFGVRNWKGERLFTVRRYFEERTSGRKTQ